jgi:voltage-gated potassium channel
MALEQEWVGLIVEFLVVLTVSSTLLFSYLEGRTLFDSLYWSIMTITTVGYGDIIPTHDLSKLTAILLSISGYASFTAINYHIALNAAEVYKRISKKDDG